MPLEITSRRSKRVFKVSKQSLFFGSGTYYLSDARYKSKIIRPARTPSNMFSTPDIDPVIIKDSDDD
ncbi:hypothetical protein PV327_007451 [Microctonus hyperodae]|uniref:Uncharacterized protein n=1 Tax=Microctonus hyperodae TaxID=165561 RepID=A0AA39FZI9_MICHY|nr:hypothetical protein PV327_007451 [Microctonus hyperodae]